jgi:hypothetical protein
MKTDQTPGEQQEVHVTEQDKEKEHEENDIFGSMIPRQPPPTLRQPPLPHHRRRETFMEVTDLTKEIETLRANQLRLKIDQELHTST